MAIRVSFFLKIKHQFPFFNYDSSQVLKWLEIEIDFIIFLGLITDIEISEFIMNSKD